MSTVRARCVYYETCFVMRDDAAGPLVIDPFETAVHPVLSKMNRRVSSDCEAERHDPTEVHHHGRRGFSLHLSPKQRIICNSEAVLSPISDKSETNGGEVVTVKSHVSRCRPALSLFKPIGYNNTSSDSGISAGGSAASSHEALLQRPSGFKPVSLSNSHELLEESLPFLMPKLHRQSAGLAIQLRPAASVDPQQQQQQPVRQLSLPFSFALPSTSVFSLKELADESLPVESQRYYHGSITRRDAEQRLKPEPTGTFLVRDSLASRYDYFLAARGENGFLHVMIRSYEDQDDHVSHPRSCFSLATLPDRRFPSVSAVINHCANTGLYSRHCPPLILKFPLAEHLV